MSTELPTNYTEAELLYHYRVVAELEETARMAKAIWTPEARADLKAIVLYIGRQDRRPSTAARIAREIKAKCDDYAIHFATGSVMGTHRPEPS